MHVSQNNRWVFYLDFGPNVCNQINGFTAEPTLNGCNFDTYLKPRCPAPAIGCLFCFKINVYKTRTQLLCPYTATSISTMPALGCPSSWDLTPHWLTGRLLWSPILHLLYSRLRSQPNIHLCFSSEETITLASWASVIIFVIWIA